MPKLSIIIPAYKASGTIKKALDSLYESSFKDFEIIVVKDGPDSAVDEVLKAYKKLYVFEQEHGGAPKARNHGAAKANGDILLFWDADCFIAPDSLRRWIEVLDANKDVAFVYSGYAFDNRQGIAGEPFDPWTLRVNNYICTMSPVRKEWFPGFDESLKSLQDWDLWLTVAEKGGKGQFVPGFAFETLLPSEGSISGEGCTEKEWLNRVGVIKKKHNIPERNVCIASLGHKEEGIAFAKAMDADFKTMPSFQVNKYDLVLLLGMYPQEADTHSRVWQNGPEHMKRVVHYTGKDVDLMLDCPFRAITKLAKGLNEWCANVCEDETTAKALARLGIQATVMPLPLSPKGLLTELPQSFKVLVHADEMYKPLSDGIIKAMPDVEFVNATDGPVKMADFTVLLRLAAVPTVGEQDKRALMNGRYMISNIQAPYAGFLSPDKGLHDFKHKVVEKIEFYRGVKEINHKAQKHYLEALDPKVYREFLDKLVVEARSQIKGEVATHA